MGSGPPEAPTNVPFADSRSSTKKRVPSVVSCACRRLTPVSSAQSTSGWMFRLTDGRPTRAERLVSTTERGGPAEGIGSGLCDSVCQAGSTQTSTTQRPTACGTGTSGSPEPSAASVLSAAGHGAGVRLPGHRGRVGLRGRRRCGVDPDGRVERAGHRPGGEVVAAALAEEGVRTVRGAAARAGLERRGGRAARSPGRPGAASPAGHGAPAAASTGAPQMSQ